MIIPDLQSMIDTVTEESLVSEERWIVEIPESQSVELKVDHSFISANDSDWSLWRMDQVYGMTPWQGTGELDT